MKVYNNNLNVLEAARNRIASTISGGEIIVSLSGGKDSTVLTHLVMEEAIRRGIVVNIFIVDLEAQYSGTIEHLKEVAALYCDHIRLWWFCLPLSLRNSVSNFEPKWVCWDKEAKDTWVRPLPDLSNINQTIITEENNPIKGFCPGVEFEEFVLMFADHIKEASGRPVINYIGIRADESLNRFRTIASKDKRMYKGYQYTTESQEGCYNCYPIYDWKTQDIWKFHQVSSKPYNGVYALMFQAGLSIHDMRLCQPYGDDQKKGLWLYHILEPKTWPLIIGRVNGANQGALYAKEHGNITGSINISKPVGHTWKSYTMLLLSTLPEKLRLHYIDRFTVFITNWAKRGYVEGIPDWAPKLLENKQWAPSWRRLARVLLRNDYWCKGLGFTQPKSAAYGVYLEYKRKAKETNGSIKELVAQQRPAPIQRDTKVFSQAADR